MGSDELAVILARVEAKVDAVKATVDEAKEEVRQQGTTLVAVQLFQARTEQRLQEGSKQMAAIRVERDECEARSKAALATLVAQKDEAHKSFVDKKTMVIVALATGVVGGGVGKIGIATLLSLLGIGG